MTVTVSLIQQKSISYVVLHSVTCQTDQDQLRLQKLRGEHSTDVMR